MSKISEERKYFNTLLLWGLLIEWIILAVAVFLTSTNAEQISGKFIALVIWVVIGIWLLFPETSNRAIYEVFRGRPKGLAILMGMLFPFWCILFYIVFGLKIAINWLKSNVE